MDNFIGNNINALRFHKGLNQEDFAAIAHVSQTSVSAWETDCSIPRSKAIDHILNAYPELTADDILSEERGFARRVLENPLGKPINEDPDFVEVPLYGSIAAGTPLEMIPADETHALPYAIHQKHPHAFFLKVCGESMNRVIPNGSYALVDPDMTDIRDGKIYAVSVDNATATIKRVRLHEQSIELEPDSNNSSFISHTFDRASSTRRKLHILGQVVWYTIPYGFKL